MKELIERGNVYIAQPPLFSLKKGKSQQYIKDEREFVKVMVKRAADGLSVRYGEGAAKLEGKDLARFMTVLDEYLGLLRQVDKRLRNERVTELIPKLDLAKRADFEGDKKAPPKKIERLEKELKKLEKDEGSRGGSALRRRAQSVGSELREQARRGTRHQLGTGFERRSAGR